MYYNSTYTPPHNLATDKTNDSKQNKYYLRNTIKTRLCGVSIAAGRYAQLHKLMKIYLSKNHSDEDGPLAEEGKLGIIYSSRDDLLKLCNFFDRVKAELNKTDQLHMQFRDYIEEWDSEKHIDLEVNIKDL